LPVFIFCLDTKMLDIKKRFRQAAPLAEIIAKPKLSA
jgi:hypothetical protein